MVALNGNLPHCEVSVSDGHMSLDVIGAFEFTKRSEEVHGGPVVNFGVSGFCGLFDASPLRPRSAAPVNQNDPETQFYYVGNRTYNPALGRWVQRDPIGHPDATKSCNNVSGRAVQITDPRGMRVDYSIPQPELCRSQGTFTVTMSIPDANPVAVEVDYNVPIMMGKKPCGCKEIAIVQYVKDV